MKLKGIKPLEQHIEKIVLAVILLVLLAVVSMQFLLQPNAVEVGSRSVPPESVYTELEGQAQRIESQLTDLQPQLPEVDSTDLLARYNEAFADSAQSTMELSSALGRGVDIEQAIGTTIDTIAGTSGEVGALAVPSTSQPLAISSWATLDPYALVEVPEYSAYVPSAQPFDFASVSIEASFSGQDLRSALTGDDGQGGIPRKFWAATGVTILGFEVERQQKQADGSWGPSEPIETPPMTPTPTRSVTMEDGLPELTEVVSNAAGAFEDVAHPMFPPTIAGAEWTPPSDRVELDSGSLSKTELTKRRLATKERELARLEDRPAVTRNPGQRPSGGGGKTSTRDDPPTTRPNTNNDRNRAKIQRLKDEIEELREELEELGVDVEDTRVRIGGRDGVSVLDAENIQLWAHDLGVQSGAEYRYRSRVVVNNPLFRKGPAFDADDREQQALTKDPFARGQWSSWSDPVLVGAKQYFFVSSADPVGSNAESPKASVEVFKMYYGHYRRSTISAEPGSKLQSNARVSDRLLTIDPAVISVKDAGEQLDVVLEDDKAPLPEGFRELQGRLTIDLGVYVLEIAQDPVAGIDSNGNAVAATQVILRDANGKIIVRRVVEGGEDSAAYELVSSSASQASKSTMRVTGQSAISPAYELFPDATAP